MAKLTELRACLEEIELITGKRYPTLFVELERLEEPSLKELRNCIRDVQRATRLNVLRELSKRRANHGEL